MIFRNPTEGGSAQVQRPGKGHTQLRSDLLSDRKDAGTRGRGDAGIEKNRKEGKITSLNASRYQKSKNFVPFAVLLSLPLSLLMASEAIAFSFTFTKIADTNTLIPNGSGTFTGFGNELALDGGNVAFRGNGSGGQEGIYTDIGGLTRVADLNTLIPNGTGTFNNFLNPALDGGNVAFGGRDPRGQRGIYTDIGGLTRVADETTPIPNGTGNFTGFGFPALDGGNVAFQGFGSGGQLGIYTDIGGLTLVADTNTPIPNGTGNFTVFFGSPALDGGSVAFRGLGSGDQNGIYTDIGGSLEKVIDLTDLLDGKTLSSLNFSINGLSGNSLAFLAGFTDGSRGIFRADRVTEPEPEPVPEPTSLLALLAVGAVGALGRRRRDR